MFRQFSRTMTTNATSTLLKPSTMSRAFELGAQVASIGTQITLFVYFNHKPEATAEPHHDDPVNKPAGLRY